MGWGRSKTNFPSHHPQPHSSKVNKYQRGKAVAQPKLLEKLEDLSEDLQSEVFQYIELLLKGKKVSQPVQSLEDLESKI